MALIGKLQKWIGFTELQNDLSAARYNQCYRYSTVIVGVGIGDATCTCTCTLIRFALLRYPRAG